MRLLIPVAWTAVSHAAGRGWDLPGIEAEQMPGTGKSALKSKILPGILQGFNDVEVLRALGLAGTAADTAVSAGVRRENLFKFAVFFWIGIVQGCLVPYGEGAGNVDAIGTGHAVAAVSAANFGAAQIGGADIVHEFQFLGGHDARLYGIKDAQVFIHLFHFVAAGEDNGYLGMIAQPAEGPFHRGTFDWELIVQCLDVVRGLGEASAKEAFHDDHRNAKPAGQFKAFGSGLVVDVHEIVLNLNHVPVVVQDDLLKRRIIIVEGEALVADLALLFQLLKEFRCPNGLKAFPAFGIDGVHQVKVDVVGLQFP